MPSDPREASSQEISGQVVFAQGGAWAGAVVRVRVDDLSLGDGWHGPVAQLELPLHRAVDPGFSLPFRLVVPGVDANHHYLLRVHVDQSGSGLVGTGDKISSRDCPVLEDGVACEVRVEVVPVVGD